MTYYQKPNDDGMKNLTLIALFFAIAIGTFAQSERSTDFGGIVSAEAEVGLRGPFGLSVEEELRFEHRPYRRLHPSPQQPRLL